MRYRPTLDQIQSYIPARSLDALQEASGADEVLKLAANESNFGTSPRVAEALKAELPRLFRYPDPGATLLKNKLAGRLGVEPDQIIFGDGSFELLSLVAQTFVDPGDEVVIPDLSFGWYRVTTWEMAGVVVPVPLKDNAIDLDAVVEAISPRTKVVWLCNPHNPLGTTFGTGAFRRFLGRIPESVAIILDEAYVEYVEDPDFPDSVALLSEYPNLIILRTFSKAYGLAGLRIGYGIARAETIGYLNKIRPPINVNHLAQVAASAALDDVEFTRSVVEGNAQGRRDWADFCRSEGLRWIPSQTNFLMVEVGFDGNLALDLLLKKGIAVRSGVEFGLPHWLRITVGTPRTTGEFLRPFGPS